MSIPIIAALLAAEEPSFWAELWGAIEERYFSIDMGRYEHISINSRSFLSLQTIVLGIFAGIIIASLFVAYDKKRLGGFVRKVIYEECLSPDRAKTLYELGYMKDHGVRGSLKRGTVLSKVVKCVEREAHERDVAEMRAKYIEKNGSDKGFVEPRFELDFNTAHFYIPDDEHYRAEIRFEKKGTGWRSMLLVTVVSVICAVLVCFLLPEMLQLVDNLIGVLKNSPI